MLEYNGYVFIWKAEIFKQWQITYKLATSYKAAGICTLQSLATSSV